MRLSTTTFRSVVAPIVLTAGVLVTLTACNANGRVAKPTIRGNATVAEGFDAKISSLGYAVESEAKYESVELGIGATFFDTNADTGSERGRKLSRAELVVGSVKVEELDVIEVSGGGRFYFGSHPNIHPFLGAYAVGSYIEELMGVEPGTQFGLRGGGGVELALTDNVFFDVALDYTLPLLAAESDPVFNTTVESELEGWALRVGIGFIF
ncbi:MAG: hypothetical protein AAF957_06125 [Planctomycetota bacterium]